MTRLTNFRFLRLNEVSTAVFWIGLLAACYLAVLPMSNTIALRNVVLAALFVCVALFKLTAHYVIKWPMPIIFWLGYLCFFPFIADSPSVALENLLGQWGRGVLAMLVGAGVASIFYKKEKGTAFYLGLVSAFSILVHISLLGWKAWATSSIPWGFWGRETHHADLGYAAGQAVVLLAATISAGKRTLRPLAIILVLACFLSTTVANSRAGLVFCLLGVVLVVGATYLMRSTHRRMHLLIGLAGVLLAGASVLAIAVKEDVRWRNMTSQLLAGFEGDAIQLQCEGTSSIEPGIFTQYDSVEDAQRVIVGVRGGDGARVVLLRAGLALAFKHPLGSDGSRHAFQRLLRQECAAPAVSMAHTHNGWLDTVLAVGWIGAVFYAAVLLYFFRLGFSHLREGNPMNEWALVLVALSAFWILRGFTDSVFRDHMLEMQGFVLAYAAVALRLQVRRTVTSEEGGCLD